MVLFMFSQWNMLNNTFTVFLLSQPYFFVAWRLYSNSFHSNVDDMFFVFVFVVALFIAGFLIFVMVSIVFSGLEFAIEIQLSTLINKKNQHRKYMQTMWLVFASNRKSEWKRITFSHTNTRTRTRIHKQSFKFVCSARIEFFYQINDGKTKFISVRFLLLKKIDRIE